MRLTDVLRDLGRTVAFYPGLKQITFSTTATLFLCQLIYWSDKTANKDGWIYKDSMELEDETGLTKYEQKTARDKLIDLGFIKERYKRLDHKIEFKVMFDVINEEWEKANNYHFSREEEKLKSQTGGKPMDLRDFQDPSLHEDHPDHNSAIEKKGDYVDAIEHFAQTPGLKKEVVKNQIRNEIENLMHINTSTRKWDNFIEFAYQRQAHHNEPVKRFIMWALENNFNPIYWTPDKCTTLYPQAFVDGDKNKLKENFVEELPPVKEEEYVPMPESLKKKNKLY